MRARKANMLLVAAVVAALAWPGAAGAARHGDGSQPRVEPTALASRLCPKVSTRDFVTSRIRAVRVGCQSTRRKLRAWLQRGRLPRDDFGWFCARTAPRSATRLCAYGNGQGARFFRFRLRRRG